MIYLSPEIIGCRILIIEEKVYVEGTGLIWKKFEPPLEGGVIIGYSRRDDSSTCSFNLTCLRSNNLIKTYTFGYSQHEYQFAIHSDDVPYLRKKIEDRFKRGVSLEKEKEIGRSELLDLEE